MGHILHQFTQKSIDQEGNLPDRMTSGDPPFSESPYTSPLSNVTQYAGGRPFGLPGNNQEQRDEIHSGRYRSPLS